MTLDELIENTVEETRQIPCLAGRDVINEKKGDVTAKLQADIAKNRFAVVIGWSGFTNRADSCKTCYGTVTIFASVFERPVVNRKLGGDVPTLLDAAQEIAKALNLYTPAPGQSPLVLKRISPVQEVATGVVACDVEFETNATL